jgi:AraC family transcriptional regulator, regulatory protein of adaptative response / DNA-3-methyladenine glycosylase II
VRTPRRENCRFFELAAQAERAGFRPCLRCRPELSPQQRHWSTEDAGAILLREALRCLDSPVPWTASGDTGLGALARQLGVSDRHLRRVFEARLGVSPLQYVLTRKLLVAKQLLADTRLTAAEVALASGFGSVRRFNAAMQARYGMSPAQMRGPAATKGLPLPRGASVRLSWRPPYDADGMLAFLARRALPGVEAIDTSQRCFWRSLRLGSGPGACAGWLAVHLEPERNGLRLEVSDGLLSQLPTVIWRVREAFDLDADPQAISSVLHADFPDGDGLRVPGCFGGFELAVRAVLGQQVSVAAARVLVGRLVQRWGAVAPGNVPPLSHFFPDPQVLAAAPTDGLAGLGITGTRQLTLVSLARAVAFGGLDLDSPDPGGHTARALAALPGIGPWTVQYIAMRALRWPDAWPAGDRALQRTFGWTGDTSPHRASAGCEALSQRWKPWRSYAALRAWARPANPSTF